MTKFAVCPLIQFNASVAANRALREAAEGGGTPAWLPEGAVAYADFVNGHYWDDGAETTLEAMFTSEPSYVSFDPETNVTPEGVYASFPIFTHSADLLATGFTAVVYGEPTAFGSQGIRCIELPSQNEVVASFAAYDVAFLEGEDPGYQAYTGNLGGPAIHALTFRRSGGSAMSTNGGDVHTSATVLNISNKVGIICENPVEKVVIYLPQDDAALPALSALS